MKYIIEIEDEPFGRNDDPVIPHGMDELYRAKGFNSLVFDRFGLDKLTPLNEALDEAFQNGYHAAWVNVGECEDRGAKQAYQRGLDDAWECARKLYTELIGEKLSAVYGTTCYAEILTTYTPSDSLAKLKAYEERQKADSEIKVGDEVRSNNAIRDHSGIVLALSLEGNSAKVLENDGSMMWVATNVLTKTGRHFNFLASLLEAMKGEQRDCHTCKHQLVNSIECVDCHGFGKWEPKEGTE